MENRKPFHLKNTLIVYNLFQVLFSTWLFYEVSKSLNYFCEDGWKILEIFCLMHFSSRYSKVFENVSVSPAEPVSLA